jgi:hypothetical protein
MAAGTTTSLLKTIATIVAKEFLNGFMRMKNILKLKNA